MKNAIIDWPLTAKNVRNLCKNTHAHTGKNRLASQNKHAHQINQKILNSEINPTVSKK